VQLPSCVSRKLPKKIEQRNQKNWIGCPYLASKSGSGAVAGVDGGEVGVRAVGVGGEKDARGQVGHRANLPPSFVVAAAKGASRLEERRRQRLGCGTRRDGERHCRGAGEARRQLQREPSHAEPPLLMSKQTRRASKPAGPVCICWFAPSTVLKQCQ
jgi:hypothetical protein